MTDHRFFANLLPESTARESLCRSLGISIDNDYELLKAVGGECAGALQILTEDYNPALNYNYEPIPEQEIEKAALSRISFNRLTAGGSLRISLAGAQDKWAVYHDGNTLYWPVGGSPSSHILKFSNMDYKGLSHYDLVCTGIYDGISRDLALSVGGNFDPGQIRRKDWEMLAADLGMNSRIIFRMLNEYIDALENNLTKYRSQFEEKHGSDNVLNRIDKFILNRIRRVAINIR